MTDNKKSNLETLHYHLSLKAIYLVVKKTK